MGGAKLFRKLNAVPSHFSLVALPTAEPPRDRHGSALPIPRLMVKCHSAAHQSTAGSDFKRHPQIGDRLIDALRSCPPYCP